MTQPSLRVTSPANSGTPLLSAGEHDGAQAAAVTQFVAWVGAVINAAQLKDKTWFIILLVTGLLSFGFIAMIIYLIAGPDDSAPHPATTAAREAPPRDLRRRSA